MGFKRGQEAAVPERENGQNLSGRRRLKGREGSWLEEFPETTGKKEGRGKRKNWDISKHTLAHPKKENAKANNFRGKKINGAKRKRLSALKRNRGVTRSHRKPRNGRRGNLQNGGVRRD